MPPSDHPALKLENLVPALSSLTRWRMLVELGKGEPLPAAVLARRVRVSPNAASKHLVVMHKAGLLERGYGNLYRIPKGCLLPGQDSVDFGAFILRLDYPDPSRKRSS